MADIQIHLEEFGQAHTLLEKCRALIIQHDLVGSREEAEYFKTMATYHLNQNQYQVSIEQALKSNEIFDKIGLSNEQIDCLKIVDDSYHSTGNFEKAFLFERKRCDLYAQIQARRSDL